MPFPSIEKFLGKDHSYQIIRGIDEAGRGPWAGPLVACALTLPLHTRIQGLDDSKKLSAAEREKIYKILEQKAYFGLGIISSEYIDQFGLFKAVNQAFLQAVKNLEKILMLLPSDKIPELFFSTKTKMDIFSSTRPDSKISSNSSLIDFLLIDGKDKLTLSYPYKTIIKGDQKIKLIAAASIIAKVTRDRLMCEEAKKYPAYGFENHMGYGTAEHQEALKRYGITPLHRKSYAPIHALFQSELF